MAFLYFVTAVFTLSTAGALLRTPLRDFVDGRWWNISYLVALFPFLVWSFVIVVQRKREVTSIVERNALNFVIAGIAVGTLTGVADLVRVLGSPLPYLGHVGSLACAVILAIAIFRHRMLESETPLRRALVLIALAASAVFLNVYFWSSVNPQGGPAFLGIAVVTVAVLAIYRLLLLNWAEESERRKRLALVGTMAAGVAHEIKNPLASIKGAAQLVQRELEGKETANGAGEYLKLLVGEVDRLNGVVEDFLAYARPREPRRRDASLNELVEEVLKLQRTALPAGVELKSQLDPSLPVVSVDPELLKQALINVLKNAIDAVAGNGTITVRTGSLQGTLRSYEVVEIEDTGPGVPLGDVERLFQPFYTTKTRGTGLGLAIAARVMEAHDGQIAVENAVPHGAKFSFHIPRRRL
jgi:signal transduction histidine kinase